MSANLEIRSPTCRWQMCIFLSHCWSFCEAASFCFLSLALAVYMFCFQVHQRAYFLHLYHLCLPSCRALTLFLFPIYFYFHCVAIFTKRLASNFIHWINWISFSILTFSDLLFPSIRVCILFFAYFKYWQIFSFSFS